MKKLFISISDVWGKRAKTTAKFISFDRKMRWWQSSYCDIVEISPSNPSRKFTQDKSTFFVPPSTNKWHLIVCSWLWRHVLYWLRTITAECIEIALWYCVYIEDGTILRNFKINFLSWKCCTFILISLVQLATCQHWLRQWLGQATSHCLN